MMIQTDEWQGHRSDFPTYSIRDFAGMLNLRDLLSPFISLRAETADTETARSEIDRSETSSFETDDHESDPKQWGK